MKKFIVGMLVGAVSGLCAGAIMVAKNQKFANKINSTIESGEEKIKQFANKLKGEKTKSETGNCDLNCPCS